MSDIAFRTMTEAEVALAIDWAAAEGWNPGLSDPALFRAVDDHRFFVAEEAGEPVATLSLALASPDLAFLGFYMVRPDRRGRGIGHRLWNHALGERPVRTIGLDAVEDQEEVYRRSGFFPSHRNIRHAGFVPEAEGPVEGVRPVEPADVAEIVAYDAGLFGRERATLLTGWLTAPGHVALRAEDEGGRLAGYGVVRPCRSGFKIAPLLAETPQVATRLFVALSLAAGVGAKISIDCPEPNRAGGALAEAAGLFPVFEMVRMYRGPAPDLPLDRIFALTSYELG